MYMAEWILEMHAGVWQKEPATVVGHHLRSVGGQRCSHHPAASRCSLSGSIRTDLGGEGAEPVYVEGVEDDEHYPLNTSFSEEETVEARALLPCLGDMRVQSGHRILYNRVTIVCVKCGGYSLRVARKLRRACPGNRRKWAWKISRERRIARLHGLVRTAPIRLRMRPSPVW